MRNLKITLEYAGTRYCGWQIQTRQKLKPSIQEILEKSLQKILQEKVKLIGSGRTDAGVHAQAQTANFKTGSNILLDKLQKGLNALLPEDIAVIKIEEARLDFHSRFDAKSKVYRYIILNQPYRSVFLKDQTYFYPYSLNVKLMQKESKILVGRHNFKSFQAADKKERDPVKTIKKIRITKDNGLIYIDIEADGFLYNMVRNIVGTLIEIGTGKQATGSLKRILRSGNRKLAGPTVPARGLCLVKVTY